MSENDIIGGNAMAMTEYVKHKDWILKNLLVVLNVSKW